MKFLLSLMFIVGLAQVSLAGGINSEVLDEINLARTSPRHYAQLLAQRMAGTGSPEGRRALTEAISFLQRAKPLPALSFSEGLALSAQLHVSDQGAQGTFGHGGSDHSSPWGRMARFGHYLGHAGENISYGHSDAGGIVAQLIIDQGVSGRGHRKNIFSPNFTVAGAACGSHARFGAMCVIDFAGGFENKALAVSGADSGHGS